MSFPEREGGKPKVNAAWDAIGSGDNTGGGDDDGGGDEVEGTGGDE